MAEGEWSENALLFDCGGERLVGVVTRPARALNLGVLIVVGGPQYRAGSHRQFTLLARQLGDSGIASCRFDYRGMGDSEGERRGFGDVGDDIRAAIDAFLASVPEVDSVIIWGLCDAASAALFYAHTDERVRGLVLLNPWTENQDISAGARLTKYYPTRLLDSGFWGKALRMEVNPRSMLWDMVRSLPHWMGGHTSTDRCAESMLDGMNRFKGETLFILSERDLTAQAFNLLVKKDARWQNAFMEKNVSFQEVAQADHTFSTRTWRGLAATLTIDFVGRLVSRPVGAGGSADSALAAELTPLDPAGLASLEQEWERLEADASASFFQSWTWMGAWLRSLPEPRCILVLRVRDGSQTVALGLFGQRRVLRHRFLRAKSLLLSETGDASLDTLTVEHNDLLIRVGHESRAWTSAMSLLAGRRDLWEELRIPGVSRAQSADIIMRLADDHGLQAAREIGNRFFWVDLDGIRQAGKDYLGSLSSNSRQQIRKAIKLYGEHGPLTVTPANCLDQALAFFDELRTLHQAHWRDKGHPGAFATPFANAFHHELIHHGFAQGRIQLLRITAGDRLIGLLYNFVFRDVVSNYQAGFVYDDNPKLKPGLVCHALSIEMNLQAGMQVYDFLMGESQYKRSLSNREDAMDWLTIQRPLFKFRAESLARAIKQRITQRLTEGRAP